MFFRRRQSRCKLLQRCLAPSITSFAREPKFLVVDRQGGGCNLNEFSVENIDLKIDLESIRNPVSDID